MASEQDLGVAIEDLDELYETLRHTVALKGLNNKSVIWTIKVWTKIAIRTTGSYRGKFGQYFIRMTAPPPLVGNEKRSQVLLRALEGYLSMLQNHGTTGGDYFNRAHLAMVYFAQDYWQHTVTQTDPRLSERDFSVKLRDWLSKSENDMLREALTKMDAHA